MEQVRESARYLPELELVALDGAEIDGEEIDGAEIVGYALASATTINDGTTTWDALYLGPICTREDRRDAGGVPAGGRRRVGGRRDATRGTLASGRLTRRTHPTPRASPAPYRAPTS